MYLGLVLSESRKLARSLKPSLCAMTSISASMRVISRRPIWWIWSGVRLLMVVRLRMSLR